MSEDRNNNTGTAGVIGAAGSDMNSDTNRGSANRGGAAAGFHRDESDRR